MANEPHAAFGDLLRHARREAGLTQEELAERAGVSTRAVSNLERGINRSPHRDTLEMLVQALGLSSEEAAQWERARMRLTIRSTRRDSGSEAGGSRSGNLLPAMFTTFIGREQEIAEVTKLTLRPDTRLLTVTGAGGIGKTRLSIKVADCLQPDFPGGVFFVPLASITHSDLIPAAIAQVLGVREGPGQTPLQSLNNYLRDRCALLVLDNFEHVVTGVSAVVTLLEECPELTMLVTSRVPLRLRGEREYQLRSLRDEASATLFVERSRDVRPSFDPQDGQLETIARICHRLDGLPLAIELAAARSNVLSPQSLLVRLEHPLEILSGGPRDLPTRQQTLRNTIAWSYDLLHPPEQELFQIVSIFMGGFTLEAVEAVAERDVLESLTALIESSLVEQHDESGGEPRFRMLETIREFGLELLTQRGAEACTRERHARYMVELLAAAPPFLIGPDQIAWLDRLETEYANIQAALDWCLEWDVEAGLRMLGVLWSFWWLRTPLTVGRQYFDRFLERADDSIDPATLAAALTGAGIITEFESDLDWDRASALYEQALSIWLDLPDPPEGAHWSYLNLGGVAVRKDNFREAGAYYHQAMDYARRHNQPIGMTAALLLLGNLASHQGQNEQAMTCYQEGLVLAREIQDPFLTAAHLGSLGRMLMYEGRLDEARQLLAEALALNRAVKLTRHVAASLENLAAIELIEGRTANAARLFRESLHEARKVHDSTSIGWGHLGLGLVALKLGDLSEARKELRQGLTACRSGGDQTCVALAAEGLAVTCIRAGDAVSAVRLHAWVTAYRERLDVPPKAVRQAAFESDIAAMHEVLTPAEFEEAWMAGTLLTLDQICAGLAP